MIASHFNNTIVPIVRIELNSIQTTEVVLVVRVFCYLAGSVSVHI